MGIRHDSRPKHTIPAVTKAMELLRALVEPGRETTTKALALRLGIPRTTCYRILRSLIDRDWVRPTAGGRHEISLGLLPLLESLRPVTTLATAVEPALRLVAARSQLTAKVSVRQGDYAVTVARVESPQQTSVAVRLGAAFHLAYGSSGAVLLNTLAEDERARIVADAPQECWEHQQPKEVARRLKELRDKGWSADLGTYRASCHAVSAPLCDGRGNVLAAMTVIGFPNDLPPKRVPATAKLLLEGVRQAEKDLRRLGVTAGNCEALVP
jgi:DNA-binding IclR family transcriptional regulator